MWPELLANKASENSISRSRFTSSLGITTAASAIITYFTRLLRCFTTFNLSMLKASSVICANWETSSCTSVRVWDSHASFIFPTRKAENVAPWEKAFGFVMYFTWSITKHIEFLLTRQPENSHKRGLSLDISNEKCDWEPRWGNFWVLALSMSATYEPDSPLRHLFLNLK